MNARNATILGLGADQARYIVDSIDRDVARVSGRDEDEVTINRKGLDELAALAEDADGHFDGQYVWIGGSEYMVRVNLA